MKRYNGFTLVELLVTMVVVVILLAVGIPSLEKFIKDNRVSGQTAKLIIALQVTRSAAIKRGSGTVICASTDQLTCSGETNWATGWITFSDHDQDGVLDGNGQCTTDAEHLSKECIMRVNTALDNVTLTGNSDRVGFLPSGLTSNGPVSFTLKGNNCEYQQQRSVTVTRQGHTFSTEQDCS